ncbi:MAG: hypothetical protein ACRBF0_19955 [Calditrichia bacterium]
MDFFGKTLSDEELAQKKQEEDNIALASRYEKLKSRFNNNQPWFVRNAHWRNKAEFFSYVANIASCLGLSYATIIMLDFIPIPYVNYVLAVVILVSFEYLKRKFSDMFWDTYHSCGHVDIKSGLVNFVLLFGLSLAGTGYGVWFYAQDNDPGAAALRAELAKVEESINTHETNKNKKGEIYWNSQETLKELGKERQVIKSKISKIEGEEIITTEDSGYVYEKASFRKYGSLLLAVLLEIVFEVCMSFMSKFDFHRFKLAEQAMAKNTSPRSPSVAEEVVRAYNELRAEHDLLKAQLSSEGSQNSSKVGNTELMAKGSYQDTGMQISMPWSKGLQGVATGCNRVATDETEVVGDVEQLKVDRLTLALKNAQANLRAWSSKLNNGKGKKETAERHINKWSGIIDNIQEEITACTA